MSRRRTLTAGLLLAFVLGSPAVAGPKAWEEQRLGPAGSVRVVEIELYRGIVRFRPQPAGEAVTLRTALVPYDTHRPGEAIEPSVRPIPSGALAVSRQSEKLRIGAPTVRDLIVVDLRAPAATALRIHIVHYGEVTIAGARGELEIDQFQGRVDLREIGGPALVHIVRDGSIRARLAPPVAPGPMAFTTYEGDIDLELPGDLAGRIQVGTARGVIRNELSDSAGERPRDGEPTILVRNARGTIHVQPLP